MKRCPQCLFIYPESDTRCDFDNTPLVVVDETELEAATGQSTTPPKPARKAKKRKRKSVVVMSVMGLLFGVIAFAITSYKLSQRDQDIAQIQPLVNAAPTPETSAPLVVVASSAVETASPSPSPAATPKPAAERVATAHSSTTVAPVSTSGPGLGKKLGGRPVILLNSGGKIEADEVWRTRDGVWYRRNGIVTLLKSGRVKAIANQ